MIKLRIIIGVGYPLLCIVSTSCLMQGFLEGWNRWLFLFFGFQFISLFVPLIVFSILMEFVVNAKVKKNILAIFLGGLLCHCLLITYSLIYAFILSYYLSENLFDDGVLSSINFFNMNGFLTGVVASIPLRYLYIKGADYKKGAFILRMVLGGGLFVMLYDMMLLGLIIFGVLIMCGLTI